MELISVIVPVYNVEKYLNKCVESVRCQTYTNLEIILVDDGSPDNCPELCEQMAAEDKRIKVVHKDNGGLGLARNSGLEVVTGEYVTFIDSDDWISKDHIENLYKEIKKTEADIAFGSYSVATDTQHSTSHQIRIDAKLYSGDTAKNEILLAMIGPDVDFPQDVQIESSACFNLYRTSVIAKNFIRFPSEKTAVGEDMFFNVLCIYFSQRVVVTTETGYYYFDNQASITRKYDPLRYERTLNFYKNACDLVKKCVLENQIAHRVERTFLLKLRTAIRLVVMSDMPRSEKIGEIKRYLNNETVAAVIGRYPIETFIPAMRLLAKLMRSKNATGVYYLMKFREAAKGQRLLKRGLKLIGIGK